MHDTSLVARDTDYEFGEGNDNTGRYQFWIIGFNEGADRFDTVNYEYEVGEFPDEESARERLDNFLDDEYFGMRRKYSIPKKIKQVELRIEDTDFSELDEELSIKYSKIVNVDGGEEF